MYSRNCRRRCESRNGVLLITRSSCLPMAWRSDRDQDPISVSSIPAATIIEMLSVTVTNYEIALSYFIASFIAFDKAK